MWSPSPRSRCRCRHPPHPSTLVVESALHRSTPSCPLGPLQPSPSFHRVSCAAPTSTRPRGERSPLASTSSALVACPSTPPEHARGARSRAEAAALRSPRRSWTVFMAIRCACCSRPTPRRSSRSARTATRKHETQVHDRRLQAAPAAATTTAAAASADAQQQQWGAPSTTAAALRHCVSPAAAPGWTNLVPTRRNPHIEGRRGATDADRRSQPSQRRCCRGRGVVLSMGITCSRNDLRCRDGCHNHRCCRRRRLLQHLPRRA